MINDECSAMNAELKNNSYISSHNLEFAVGVMAVKMKEIQR